MVDVALVGLTHVDLNYPEHVVGIPAEEMKAKLDAHDLKLNGTALSLSQRFYQWGPGQPGSRARWRGA